MTRLDNSEYRRVMTWLASKQKSLATVIECLLIIVLMYLLAGLFWQVFATLSEKPATSSVNNLASVSSTHIKSEPRYPALDSFEFFGTAPKAVAVKPVKQADIAAIPRSRLPLRLTGLLAHPNPQHALAIVENRGSQRSYRIGETIRPQQAKVIAIHPDRVIVQVEGKDQALMLYPNQKTSTVLQVNNHQSSDKTPSSLKELAQNPKKITELISISPAGNGYRINPKKHPELFQQAGLKRNDIVVAMNGYDLKNPASVLEILNNIDTLQRIDLTVEREGMLHQVELSL
ncbi:type II secretion system protein GspC [Endozoicomonadaceae bacterium StTr2]